MKTDQSLINKNIKKTKIIKLNNSTNVDDQIFDRMKTITLFKDDDERREKFLSLYSSENRLVINEHDNHFYKAFKAFLNRNKK